MDRDPNCSELATSDFNLIGHFKNRLAGKGFATGVGNQASSRLASMNT